MYHHLSQILLKQHISNYSSNQSMGAKKILHIMRKSPSPPHRENGTKKIKNALYMKKASPSPQEGEKGPTNRLFSRGTRQAPTLAAPLRAPMSEYDYKIHNIYSTLIYMYIKIHSRMHPIELLKKKFSEEHTLESSSNEIEQRCIYTPYERQRKRDVLQYLPLSKKLPPPPHCLNIDLYPSPPPPPDNDRVCDHNALLAFPQEKISHYTTDWSYHII